MKSQYSGTCSVCQIAWNVGEEIFYQKDPKAICSNEDCFKTQGGKPFVPKAGKFTSSKFPISKADEIYDLAENLLTKFLGKRTDPISPEQQAIFIESMFKTLSTSYKE